MKFVKTLDNIRLGLFHATCLDDGLLVIFLRQISISAGAHMDVRIRWSHNVAGKEFGPQESSLSPAVEVLTKQPGGGVRNARRH